MDETIVQISVFPGWIVGVSYDPCQDGYRCWIVDAEYTLMSDGRSYETSHSAMLVGRAFVENHLS
ncbi:hypothetical protein IFO70_01535 [Phormidium tenue FACHB-886]|nr:hypothetical protein [Phormidium tenue FACHB-886]